MSPKRNKKNSDNDEKYYRILNERGIDIHGQKIATLATATKFWMSYTAMGKKAVVVDNKGNVIL